MIYYEVYLLTLAFKFGQSVLSLIYAYPILSLYAILTKL